MKAIKWDPAKLANRYAIPPKPRGAVLSKDRRHRYLLWRIWTMPLFNSSDDLREDTTKMCAFIGLNPSTADEMKDDPTIRRCMAFAKAWDFDGMWMLNLWAFRATDPADLKIQVRKDVLDAEGLQNVDFSRTICRNVDCIVLAWGAHGLLHKAGYSWAELMNMVRGRAPYNFECLKCLGTTMLGEPKHPLYLRADTKLMDFPGYEDD